MAGTNGGLIRDFFGKKLGGWLGDVAGDISPLDFSRRGTAAGRVVRTNLARTSEMDGLGSAAISWWQQTRQGYLNRNAVMPPNDPYTVGDWFSGLSYGEARDSVDKALMQRRMITRMALPVAAGISSVSSIVAPDNPIDQIAGTGISAAATFATAGILGRGHWMAGAAFSGLSLLNLLRRGDNLGPF